MTRRTFAHPITLHGHAVRTHGGPVELTLGPGDEGLVFVREDGRRWPATLDHLVEVPNCTALGEGRPEVLFVEHVLSACAGLGVTDAELGVTGPEVPLFDGSARPLVDAIREAGTVELDGECVPIQLPEPIWQIAGDKAIVALPAESWSVDYTFVHAHPMIRHDHLSLDDLADYAEAIAPARTFATEEEIRALMEQGLIQGGSEDNLLVVYADRFSAPLRLEHEFAAHKVLDLLGDLYLLGRPLQARLIACRTGHGDNHSLAASIAATCGSDGS